MKKFTRATLLAFTVLAFAGIHNANAANSFSPAQQDDIKAVVHTYLVAHPEVLIEAMTAYQHTQEKLAEQDFQKKYVKYKDFMTSPDTPFAGNPNGKKAVVEFFDYNCPYCKKTVDDIQALIKQDSDVKVYFKDFPILSSTSVDAAHWALAAGKQGKYFEFHVAMMKTPTPGERSTKDMYIKIGHDLGLDVEKLEKDAASDPAIDAAIKKDIAVARDLGITGTPAFIIHDTLYPGYMGLDNMKKVVDGTLPAADGAKN